MKRLTELVALGTLVLTSACAPYSNRNTIPTQSHYVHPDKDLTGISIDGNINPTEREYAGQFDEIYSQTTPEERPEINRDMKETYGVPVSKMNIEQKANLMNRSYNGAKVMGAYSPK